MINFVIALVAGYVVISFAEYFLHQYLMHKKSLPEKVYQVSNHLLDIYEAHAIRHHAHWYREFDFEPDPEGRVDNIYFRLSDTFWLITILSPFFIIGSLFSPMVGVILLSLGILHNVIWGVVHGQMHMPRDVFFADWGIYRWLARHHYMHHQYTNKNYNVVFPFADYIMGTKINATKFKHIREMLYLGYLKPRSQAAKSRVQTVVANVSEQRQALLAASV